MKVVGNVLTDLIHLFKIFIVFRYFFKFYVRGGEHKILKNLVVAFVMVVTSVYININENEVINTNRQIILLIVFMVLMF